MEQPNESLVVTNIVVKGNLGYAVDMMKYRVDHGEKLGDIIKKNKPFDNKIVIDGVKILVFPSGIVNMYGKSFEVINKRWELLKQVTDNYKVK